MGQPSATPTPTLQRAKRATLKPDASVRVDAGAKTRLLIAHRTRLAQRPTCCDHISPDRVRPAAGRRNQESAAQSRPDRNTYPVGCRTQVVGCKSTCVMFALYAEPAKSWTPGTQIGLSRFGRSADRNDVSMGEYTPVAERDG
jgi:hypothetical protein